jgi:hypothetical protein
MSSTLLSPLDARASLDSAEVAEVTGYTQKTIRKYARLGLIPGAYQPFGKRGGWRFKRALFQKWWDKMGK